MLSLLKHKDKTYLLGQTTNTQTHKYTDTLISSSHIYQIQSYLLHPILSAGAAASKRPGVST